MLHNLNNILLLNSQAIFFPIKGRNRHETDNLDVLLIVIQYKMKRLL